MKVPAGKTTYLRFNHAYGFVRTADYAALAIVALALVVGIDGAAALVEARARRWAS